MPKTAKQWPFRAISLSRALSRSCSTTTATSAVPPPPPSFPLKHVTRSNFESALADLRSVVRAADFVAIDLEMTGVTSSPWRESFEFDRFDVRYLKVKDSAEKFAVVQFGVCPFRWDSQSLSFIAHPHNFFVFPRQELLVDGSSYEFLCQTTSIDFLAKYQFDFNACINGGISYLSRVQEDEAVTRLNLLYEDCQLGSRHSLKEVRDTPLVSMTDVFFSERMKIRLGEWHDALLRDRNLGSPIKRTLNDSNQPFQTIFFKMRPALALNGFTSHQLKLIQSVSKKHFKDLAYICMNGEGSSSQHLVVYTDSEHDKDLLMKEVKDEHRKGEEMKIKNTIGFRHVIDLLSSEQKLIVGHNCFLDVAHIYSKFFGPLPSTAEKFVTSVNKYFPQIIDTKVLLNANDILQLRMKRSSTSLSSAFSSLCPQIALGSQRSDLFFQSRVKVEVQVDDTRSSIWSSGAKHEAGYDAFMTGCIFAQACSHLGIDFKVFSPTEHLANSEKLQKHMNLLYLSWTNGDTIDLSTGHRTAGILSSSNLKKRYPKILFENIVLVWGFPSKLKAMEIKECVCKVFGPTSVTSIYHLDETAVFVQFGSAELVSEFLVLKETLERNDNAISVLHPLSKLLEGGNTHAADYGTYKEICSSPISKVLFADQAEAVGIKWKTKLVESEVEVRTQDHECSHKQSTVNSDSDSIQKNRRKIDYAIRSSGHDINDSIYDTEIKQISAANL
ncbi:poly(A)-specific ribonuclease PARN-like isoform X1 [Tripterygium wilfordii]|uniref:poly(A)-specific ribonuclease PARN-like isoform X1 n=1 Tax=Tripterygium wilfordii TaxID=458696 RepID=UPI0018F8587D|nr:poly(A)-specific ribonuclease PARN-like isoform X1 [Tripterygium wilfordii]